MILHFLVVKKFLRTQEEKNIKVAPIYDDFNQLIDENKNLLINAKEDILFI